MNQQTQNSTFVEACDRIKEDDQRYSNSQKLVKQSGCDQVNQDLSDCLKKSNKDWRFCQDQTKKLAECVRNQKKNN